jgi:hypothetical protein
MVARRYLPIINQITGQKSMKNYPLRKRGDRGYGRQAKRKIKLLCLFGLFLAGLRQIGQAGRNSG